MGGGSPLLPETRKQASALEAELKAAGHEARVFIAMRYWKPFSAETATNCEPIWSPPSTTTAFTAARR
jgi:ferrochelatase